MRLNILWKLILTIALPLLGIYVALNFFEFNTLRDQAIRDINERVTRLATLYAQQFDGELSTIAQVARSTAEFLAIDPEMGRNKSWLILEQNIKQNELIYGAALAWKPREEDGRTILSAPYVHRGPDGEMRRMDIGTDAYDYRTSDWYTMPISVKTGTWTEPYFDEGAGNILMSTYAEPIFDEAGDIIAITTVDLHLEELQESMSLDELDQGTFIIVSRNDRFISHPVMEMIMTSGLGEIAEKSSDPDVARIRAAALAGDTGSSELPKFINGSPHWIAYAPIPSTGWSFVAAFPRDDVLAPVYEDLFRDIVIVAIGFAVNVIAIIFVALLFTRPIRRLSSAMEAVTEGDMDARVEGVDSHDEFGDLARGFNDMSANLRSNIDELATERAERHAVDVELNLAREIQASLLPDEDAIDRRDTFELDAINLPARQVAGDFYDYWMQDESTMAFLIADVSGKGVPAAFFMGIARTLIRNLAKLDQEPDALMSTVNELLLESNKRSMFVTLFYGIYALDTGQLHYVNAGHLPPARISGSKPIETVGSSTGTVLGAIPDTTWTVGTLQIAEGDMLVFCTDGVTEAQSSDGTMLDEEGFLQMLETHRSEDSSTLCHSIIDFIDHYQDGEQADDITVLALKRTKSASPSPGAA